MYEAEDKKRKEAVENKNKLDSLIFQVEKTVKDSGDKLSEEDKSTVENAVKEAKEALNSEDNDKITAATEKLSKDIEPVFTKLYQQAAANGQAGANGANGAGAGADDTAFHQN